LIFCCFHSGWCLVFKKGSYAKLSVLHFSTP
jgi:hypothetical protein